MGGLEKIIQDISAQADTEIAAIESDANEKIAGIKNDGETKKSDIRAQMTKQTQDECMKLSEMIEASAESEARRIILEAKNNSIDKILEYIKASVKNADAAEYFANLLKLAAVNCEDGDGVMYLCKKDLARLPADFEEKVNMSAKGRITISPDAADIDSGFIIKYGKVDINCSVDSLFEDKKNTLSDIINQSLSKKG